MVLLQDTTELYRGGLPLRLDLGPAHIRRIFHRQRARVVLERCHMVSVDVLHLFIRQAQNALQGLADGVVFVEMVIAIEVLDHDFIDVVVATEDIEVVTAADCHCAKEVHLSRDIAIHGNLAQGIEVGGTGGKGHGSAGYPLFPRIRPSIFFDFDIISEIVRDGRCSQKDKEVGYP